jgi:hypothetical protein
MASVGLLGGLHLRRALVGPRTHRLPRAAEAGTAKIGCAAWGGPSRHLAQLGQQALRREGPTMCRPRGQARPAHSANNANTFPNHGGSGAQALRLEGPVILLTDLDPWQLGAVVSQGSRVDDAPGGSPDPRRPSHPGTAPLGTAPPSSSAPITTVKASSDVRKSSQRPGSRPCGSCEMLALAG